MCGIAGTLPLDGRRPDGHSLRKMIDRIRHRGPDDSGFHLDPFAGLGHARLSIIDSAHGHQPMCNEDGSVWTTYNGEIYNHEELRADLEGLGHSFSTHCDTEVVVHAYEEYGEDCVQHFVGQFAFAVWDSRERVLFLARDRMGQKPLHFTEFQGTFLFASETKALFAYPGLAPDFCPLAVSEALLCNAVLEDRTMFKGIRQLPPGHTLTVSDRKGVGSLRRYWDIPLCDEPDERDEDYYIETFLHHLSDSVEARLMSEVPLGCLLSGGVDSSIIAFCLSHLAGVPPSTFTIGYRRQFDSTDVEFSGVASSALGSKHRLFMVDQDEFYSAISEVSWHLERPFELGAPSLYLLFERIVGKARVVLSGEGSDELLGGYLNLKGLGLGRAIDGTQSLRHVPWVEFHDQVLDLLHPDFKSHTDCAERIPDVLQSYYRDRMAKTGRANQVLYLFQKIFLVELLQSQDRLGLAWSIESRAPFLDHRLVEWISRLPIEWKVRGRTDKYLLRRSIEKRALLPATIARRTKKPIPYPKGESFRQQVEQAAQMLLSPESLSSVYFDTDKLRRFLTTERRRRGVDRIALYRISFSLLTLEALHRRFRSASVR